MAESLSKYFLGIGAKRLTAVEIRAEKSNQHEFNGVSPFKELFGTDKIELQARFIFLADNEEECISSDGILTWYDARENHEIRTEYRIYYSSNDIISNASEGDLLIIGRTAENSASVIITRKGSTSEKQLLWLFNLQEIDSKIVIRDFSNDTKDLGFAGKYIISSMGFEPEEDSDRYLDLILRTFGDKFPSTYDFSKFARSTLDTVSAKENPDETLLQWLDREETLFKTLERYLVQNKLRAGFGNSASNVDDFIKFSLSVQNRRKSRAGFAFEHQLAEIFNVHGIWYTKKGKTENNYEPDFLFPSIEKYYNLDFDTSLLTMLGLKTSAKERWRQVLPEANKIWPKHLITLEPSISKNQTDQMKSEKVQLVIPNGIMNTYSEIQQTELINLSDFIKLVLHKQKRNPI